MSEKRARAPRVHVAEPLRAGAELALPEEAAHHLRRVLRAAPGDALVVFDGRGGEHPAVVLAVERARVVVHLGAHQPVEREAQLRITLAQGVSSGERMDFTVQKATELGVAAIQPLTTARSVVRLAAERAAARRAHWQRVAVSACEQCGRNRIPEVRAPRPLAGYCAAPDAGLKLRLAPGAPEGLHAAARGGDREIVLAAGPEAGFDEAEQAALERAGFRPVRLGARVLRSETAALAALAALLALAGEL